MDTIPTTPAPIFTVVTVSPESSTYERQLPCSSLDVFLGGSVSPLKEAKNPGCVLVTEGHAIGPRGRGLTTEGIRLTGL